MDQLIASIKHAIDALSMPGIIAVGTVIVELVLRLVKSEKPRSLLYAAPAALRKLGAFLSGAAEQLGKVAAYIDGILPLQRLK